MFLGCNLWAGAFLAAAIISGWLRSPHHVRIAVFATVFACLVQCGVIALFLGAAKLTKEHVGRFGMPLSLIDRLNAVYHRLVPAAAVCSTLMAAAAIVGGLADVGRAPVWLHEIVALAAGGLFYTLVPFEFRLQSDVHRIIGDLEKFLPASDRREAAPPHPGYHPDRVVLDATGRARALVYIGLTLPLPYLGYTFIVGRDVSYLLIPTIVLTLAVLVAAAFQYRASRTPRGH
ncbi:MAG: hypothetical protein ACE5HU_09050 [Acidobacteriota bacterium]